MINFRIELFRIKSIVLNMRSFFELNYFNLRDIETNYYLRIRQFE